MKSFLVNSKTFLLVIFKFINVILTREFELGPCYLQYFEPCANNSILFYLFSGERPRDQPVLLDNISPYLELDSNETVAKNFKMIIHGYGGHLDFNGSKQIRRGRKVSLNFFAWQNVKLPRLWFRFNIGSTKPALHILRNFLRHTFCDCEL